MSSATPPINETLQNAQEFLNLNVESAQLEAEILLAHILDCERSYLRTWPEKKLSPEQQDHFQHLIKRRSLGEPIAYITEKKEFWDMTLHVTPDTLIPRPETEHLVEKALEIIPPQSQWQIADLGTGCGAIALALARERPHCKIVATDTSTAALAVAQKNACQLNIENVTFIEGDWFEPFSAKKEKRIKNPQFEIIISNPPYVHPDDKHLRQGDLRFEPAQALCSKPDGLTDLKAIMETARKYLVTPGWLILEHGYDQGLIAEKTLTSLGYSQVSIWEDLAKNERLCQGKWD